MQKTKPEVAAPQQQQQCCPFGRYRRASVSGSARYTRTHCSRSQCVPAVSIICYMNSLFLSLRNKRCSTRGDLPRFPGNLCLWVFHTDSCLNQVWCVRYPRGLRVLASVDCDIQSSYFYNWLCCVTIEIYYHHLDLKMYPIYSAEAKCINLLYTMSTNLKNGPCFTLPPSSLNFSSSFPIILTDKQAEPTSSQQKSL